MPATNFPFLPPPSRSRLAARWRQRFFFDPIYLVNPWEFSRNFFMSDTFPQALPIPLSSPTNSTSGLGVGPPKKNFWPPNYTKSGPTISLIFSSLIRPRVPLRSPKFGENLTTGFSARWRQKFFFDPKYLNNPWEFSEIFSKFLLIFPVLISRGAKKPIPPRCSRGNVLSFSGNFFKSDDWILKSAQNEKFQSL